MTLLVLDGAIGDAAAPGTSLQGGGLVGIIATVRCCTANHAATFKCFCKQPYAPCIRMLQLEFFGRYAIDLDYGPGPGLRSIVAFALVCYFTWHDYNLQNL